MRANVWNIILCLALLLRNQASVGKFRGKACRCRLTFYHCTMRWPDLVVWLTESVRVITTDSSCPSSLFSQSKVEWGNLAVCLSLRACLSYSSPGRRTSLLWLNRLSRDPINHHLHSPALSPFTSATSSDIRVLPFTRALHGTPMQTHFSELDACRSLASFCCLLILRRPISQHACARTLANTHSGILGLYSPAISSGQSRQLLQCALRCPFLLPSLSLSVGRLGLLQPIDLRRSFTAPLTWTHFLCI